jgi:hypothetical protein
MHNACPSTAHAFDSEQWRRMCDEPVSAAQQRVAQRSVEAVHVDVAAADPLLRSLPLLHLHSLPCVASGSASSLRRRLVRMRAMVQDLGNPEYFAPRFVSSADDPNVQVCERVSESVVCRCLA